MVRISFGRGLGRLSLSTRPSVTPRLGMRHGGKNLVLRYHRVKYALHHGWLPETVDHRDRDTHNCLLDNLRAASASLQQHNSHHPRKIKLPRGVHPADSKKNPYCVRIAVAGKLGYFGSYPSVEAANEVAIKKYREIYGDDYSPVRGHRV